MPDRIVPGGPDFMETCTNCGSAVRPGAKFCTSCGTRLNTAPPPTSDPAPVTQETQPEPATDEPEPAAFATWGQAGSGWGSSAATGDSETSSPAEPDDETSSTRYRATSWGSPATEKESDEHRFASWAAAYGTPQETTSEPASDSGTETNSAAMTDDDFARAAAATSNKPERNDAPARTDPSSSPADDDARQRATSLVDELRSLIWKIGLDEVEGGKDANLAVIVLAGARGKTGDFSDISAALDALKDDPRDIDALRGLGAKAERIEELIASHSRLLGAIDEAILEMR